MDQAITLDHHPGKILKGKNEMTRTYNFNNCNKINIKNMKKKNKFKDFFFPPYCQLGNREKKIYRRTVNTRMGGGAKKLNPKRKFLKMSPEFLIFQSFLP